MMLDPISTLAANNIPSRPGIVIPSSSGSIPSTDVEVSSFSRIFVETSISTFMFFTFQIPVVESAASKGEEETTLTQRVTRGMAKRSRVETPSTTTRGDNADSTAASRVRNRSAEMIANLDSVRPQRNIHPSSDHDEGDERITGL
jgi:hypothetical protein